MKPPGTERRKTGGGDGGTPETVRAVASLTRFTSGMVIVTYQYVYDKHGRCVRGESPSGALSGTFSYEPGVTRWTGAEGAVTEYRHDRSFRITGVVDPLGNVTRFEHDARGQLTTRTDPLGRITKYAYDERGNLLAVTRPDGSQARAEYDGAGRLAAETDFNGAAARYWHDAAGQLIRRLTAAGQETTYAYDMPGNLVSQVADGVVTTFGYDAVGRVAGRVTPSGAETRWAYGAAGLPAAMMSGAQELRFGYGPDGREVRRELPGGLTLTQSWDQVGRLTDQVLAGPGPGAGPGAEGPATPGQLLQRRAYAYNPDGFVTGVENLLTGNRSFGLDESGRVTAVTGTEWAERYAYDPAGNVAAATWPVPSTGMAASWLDAGAQGPREISGTLVARAGNIRYSHDAAGRVVMRTRTRISRKPETWRYSWDAENHGISNGRACFRARGVRRPIASPDTRRRPI